MRDPTQARALLAAVRADVPAVEGFFACLYFAGLRPAEARNLRLTDCTLPEECWGRAILTGSNQNAGAAWTDSGDANEERQLKHRSRRDTRPVPLHPELVEILHRHARTFQLGADGRLFVTRTGKAGVPLTPPYLNPVSLDTIYRAWRNARQSAMTQEQCASPLARRPYDLRHACLSTWLNAGVPAAQVADMGRTQHRRAPARVRHVHRRPGGGRPHPDRRGSASHDARAPGKRPRAFPADNRDNPDLAGSRRTTRKGL